MLYVLSFAFFSVTFADWGPKDALYDHKLRKRESNISKQQQIDIADKLSSEQIISRRDVIVTSDARGNLGPASVLVKDVPGENWLKDRWQAASDMGGTAIPGVI